MLTQSQSIAKDAKDAKDAEVEQLGHWSVLLQHGQPLPSILASFLRAVSLKIDWNSRTMVLTFDI